MSKTIQYKDTKVASGSDLFKLLEAAASEKDPKKAQELRKKAEKCYKEADERLLKIMGQEAYDHLKEINKPGWL